MNHNKYIITEINKLKGQEPISIAKDRSWLNKIESGAGVYIIERKEKIVYVGETGNLYKRMNDLRSTFNHTFRRIVGEKYFSKDSLYTKATSSKRYHDKLEQKLSIYICENYKVKVLPICLGRKEIEEEIQDKIENLYNRRTKRK